MMNLQRKLLALVAVCGLLINLLVTPSAIALGTSPLSGLITLKNLAKSSTPYQEAIANGKPTLIEFYADWCGTCQSMANTVENLENEYGDQVNLVMLDIDDPQWDDLGQEYEVTGIPQYNFLTAEEQKIESFIGRVPQSILAQAFNRLLAN